MKIARAKQYTSSRRASASKNPSSDAHATNSGDNNSVASPRAAHGMHGGPPGSPTPQQHQPQTQRQPAPQSSTMTAPAVTSPRRSLYSRAGNSTAARMMSPKRSTGMQQSFSPTNKQHAAADVSEEGREGEGAIECWCGGNPEGACGGDYVASSEDLQDIAILYDILNAAASEPTSSTTSSSSSSTSSPPIAGIASLIHPLATALARAHNSCLCAWASREQDVVGAAAALKYAVDSHVGTVKRLHAERARNNKREVEALEMQLMR